MRLLYQYEKPEKIHYTKKDYKKQLRRWEIRTMVLDILEEAELIDIAIEEKVKDA